MPALSGDVLFSICAADLVRAACCWCTERCAICDSKLQSWPPLSQTAGGPSSPPLWSYLTSTPPHLGFQVAPEAEARHVRQIAGLRGACQHSVAQRAQHASSFSLPPGCRSPQQPGAAEAHAGLAHRSTLYWQPNASQVLS